MCGRLGSTLTVCDSPMWLVSAISLGLLTLPSCDWSRLATSMNSRPPRGACWPSVPLSWQRPAASVASMSSCVSALTAAAAVDVVLKRTSPGAGTPLGVASTSCCRPVTPVPGAQLADGWLDTTDGLTVLPPSWVMRKIDWPPLPPAAKVPTEANISSPCLKKSRSDCRLPVEKLRWNSHRAPGPPDWACVTGDWGWGTGDA